MILFIKHDSVIFQNPLKIFSKITCIHKKINPNVMHMKCFENKLIKHPPTGNYYLYVDLECTLESKKQTIDHPGMWMNLRNTILNQRIQMLRIIYFMVPAL